MFFYEVNLVLMKGAGLAALETESLARILTRAVPNSQFRTLSFYFICIFYQLFIFTSRSNDIMCIFMCVQCKHHLDLKKIKAPFTLGKGPAFAWQVAHFHLKILYLDEIVYKNKPIFEFIMKCRNLEFQVDLHFVFPRLDWAGTWYYAKSGLQWKYH